MFELRLCRQICWMRFKYILTTYYSHTQKPFNGHLVILVGDVDSENLKDVPATDANPISGEVEGEGGGGEPLHVEGKGADHVHRSVE